MTKVDIDDPAANLDRTCRITHQLRGGQYVVIDLRGEDGLKPGRFSLLRHRPDIRGPPPDAGNDPQSQALRHVGSPVQCFRSADCRVSSAHLGKEVNSSPLRNRSFARRWRNGVSAGRCPPATRRPATSAPLRHIQQARIQCVVQLRPTRPQGSVPGDARRHLIGQHAFGGDIVARSVAQARASSGIATRRSSRSRSSSALANSRPVPAILDAVGIHDAACQRCHSTGACLDELQVRLGAIERCVSPAASGIFRTVRAASCTCRNRRLA